MDDTQHNAVEAAMEQPQHTMPAQQPAPAVEHHVLMTRDPDKVPGLGITKAVVPQSQVANWQAAGWTVCEE